MSLASRRGAEAIGSQAFRALRYRGFPTEGRLTIAAVTFPNSPALYAIRFRLLTTYGIALWSLRTFGSLRAC